LSFEIIRKAFSARRRYGFAFDFIQGFILKQLIGFKTTWRSSAGGAEVLTV